MPPASESGERWTLGPSQSGVEGTVSLEVLSGPFTEGITVVPESRALEAEQERDRANARTRKTHAAWVRKVEFAEQRAEQAEQSLSRAEAALREIAEVRTPDDLLSHISAKRFRGIARSYFKADQE